MKYALVVRECKGGFEDTRILGYASITEAKLKMVEMIDKYIMDNEKANDTTYFGDGYLSVADESNFLDITIKDIENGV